MSYYPTHACTLHSGFAPALMAPPRTEFGSEYRRHVTRIGTLKRKAPEAVAEDASFFPNPRNVRPAHERRVKATRLGWGKGFPTGWTTPIHP